MLSSGLELGLPEAAAGMKKPLRDPRGAWEETWTPSSQLSFGLGSHGVPATAKGNCENSACSSTHCPGRSAHVCLANIRTHGLHAQKTRPCVKLRKACHWHRGVVRAPRPSLNPLLPEAICVSINSSPRASCHLGGQSPSPPFSAHTSAALRSPMSLSCSSWGHSGARKMGVQSKGRVEPGRLKPRALRTDMQPGCLSSLPTPPPSPLFPVPQTGLLREHADHSQTSGLCLLPAQCCIGILFARHSLGFCGLGFGPSHFSLGAASWPKGKERPQSAEAAMGPRLG